MNSAQISPFLRCSCRASSSTYATPRQSSPVTTVNGQDAAAQIGQGRIADRTAEHLGFSDRGVIQVRKLWLSAIQAVQRGDDPPGILRDLQDNEMLHFDVVGSGRLVNKGEMVDHLPRILRYRK